MKSIYVFGDIKFLSPIKNSRKKLNDFYSAIIKDLLYSLSRKGIPTVNWPINNGIFALPTAQLHKEKIPITKPVRSTSYVISIFVSIFQDDSYRCLS